MGTFDDYVLWFLSLGKHLLDTDTLLADITALVVIVSSLQKYSKKKLGKPLSSSSGEVLLYFESETISIVSMSIWNLKPHKAGLLG